MREERIGRALATGLVFLPLAYVMAFLLFGFADARLVFAYGLWCVVAALVAGRLLGRLPVAVQIVACVAVAALALLLPLPWLAQVIVAALGLVLTLVVERISLKEADTALGNMLLVPLGSVLVSAAFLWIYSHTVTGVELGSSYPMLTALAAVWMVAALLLTHRSSYRDAAIAMTHRQIPPGARRSGLAGTLALLAAVFALALSGPIGRAVSWLFGGLGTALRALLLALSRFFTGDEQVSPEPEATGEGDMNQLGPVQEGGLLAFLFRILLYVVSAAILLAMFALLCYGLSRLLPKVWRDITGWARRTFGTWQEDAVAYSDRNENLLTLRQAINDAGASLRRFAKRFQPKPRLEDCATNGERVRFLFREYLQRRRQAGKPPRPGDTPAQLVGEAGRGLWEPYNRTRYGGLEPTDREVQDALHVVRDKGQ